MKEDSVYFIVYLVPTLGHGKVLNNLTVNLLYLDNTAGLCYICMTSLLSILLKFQ